MRATSTVIFLLLVAGCQPTEPAGDPDGGPIVFPDSGGSTNCGDPGGPYGTSVGSNFLPFTLPQCDGTPFAFYGEQEGFCEARFTVLTMSAGWCGPCRAEAEQMQRQLVDAYADQGVRVVVSVIQDNDYREPDGLFCQSWVDQYGLTNPVVYDVAQETGIYFPAGSLPANLIVDSEGVIRHREYGATVGLETIRAALDRLLAE